MRSIRSLFQDSTYNRFHKNTIDRSLSTKEISLLTSLKHPHLVGYYLTDDQETNKIISDFCEFGLFSNLDVSQVGLNAHDLWSMRNQILKALKYLTSQGLYHKGLNLSNVSVCSLRPISIKLSLFSNSRVPIGFVNTEIPIQEFWKQKMIEHEEVCFDELIRSIVMSVFPYSIIDKNIVFTNPNTLERSDLESLKALICSIESETMFKSGQCIGDLSTVNKTLSCIFNSFHTQQQMNLFITNTLLFHIFTEGIMKYEKPLMNFDVDNCPLKCLKKDFSNFATKLIAISVNFRNVFLRSFDYCCGIGGHCLVVGDYSSDSILTSCCTNLSQLASTSYEYFNWFQKFPITTITTDTFNFDNGFVDVEKVTKLELKDFNQNLSCITVFPNLSFFSISSTNAVHDFSPLGFCACLSSISIESCIVSDLTPFSLLEQLTCLVLIRVVVTDFSLLSTFPLTILTLNNCNIPDLSFLSSLQTLRYLTLIDVETVEFSALASLKQLRNLHLECKNMLDVSPLSCLEELVELSLVATKVVDLWPLIELTKVSTLNVSGSLLPKECQTKLTNSYDIKRLINSFEHGVDLDFSNSHDTVDISLYSHCLRLKSLNLSQKRVENISQISKLTNLETLDLSNVRLPPHNKITDISFLSPCIKLKSLSLNDSEVTDFGPLSLILNNLKSLSLNNTEFSDLSQLSLFKQLEILSLKGNRITDIYPLSSLENLGCLSLCYNQISDLSPLSCLHFLEKLYLSCNKITDISFLASLNNLVDLSLAHNRITDVTQLSSMLKLELLSLKNTSVFDLWPLKDLTILSALDVRGTLPPRKHQRELTNSYDIKILINSFEHGVDLDFSNFYDTVDLSLYSHCSRLKSLNLSRKIVENISEISKFTHLETLDLSNVKLPGNNQITDISFLSSCIKLKSLSLDCSGVTDLSPLSLASFKNLVNLSLANNNITDITPLSSLLKLERLSLYNTNVLDLWPLKKLSKLSTLDVREAPLPREHQRELTNSYDIKSLISSYKYGVDLDFSNYDYAVDLSLYSHCSRLKSLNLSEKKVENISEISKFTNLTSLDLSNVLRDGNNRITDISFLSSCIKLKSLSLDGSQVTDLSPLFVMSKHLKSLSLNNTGFSDLCQLSLFKQLEFLSLNGNSITDISFLSTCIKLKSLSLDDSRVTDLSPLFVMSKHLKSLSLNNTGFSDLCQLSIYQQLEYLSLNGNSITDISFLSSCIKLKSLSLNDSKVTDLSPLSMLSNDLKFLSLNNTEFSDLSQLSIYKQLEFLSLNCNRITDISFLYSLGGLVDLSLDNNAITDLSPLSSLFKLDKLSLNGTQVFDLWPLNNLIKLSTLDLRETLLPREHQNEFTNSYDINNLISSCKYGVDLDFSYCNGIVDISLYSHCARLKSLNLCGRYVENITEISLFSNLETLHLSNVKQGYYDYAFRITDISFLSSCIKIRSLSLDGSEVADLSPLSLLVELESLSLRGSSVLDLWPLLNLTKLSTLDVRGTVLPRKHQRELTNSSEIKTLVISFEHGFDLDFSYCNGTVDLFLYSHCLRLKSLNLSRKIVENFSEISKFTNLETLDLSNVKLPGNNQITDISFLSSCIKLKSLFFDGSKVTDLSPLSLASFKNLVNLSLANNNITDITPLSSLLKLERLSLYNTNVLDLWPLKKLSKLSTLDVREAPLPREHQRKLTNSYDIKRLINSFEHGVDLDFSYCNGTVDLSLYSHCLRLKLLNLSRKIVENISEISKFTNLETLDLSNVLLDNNNRFTDISFLSSCIKLKSLSLDGSKVTDLNPLSLLVELELLSLKNTTVLNLWPLKNLTKLSTIDVRGTLLPEEEQRKLTNSSNIKTLINSFEHGVDLDFSNFYDTVDISLYSHCSRLKSLNLSGKRVGNISEISKFSDLETLDLSNVRVDDHRLNDITFLSPCSKLKSLSLKNTEVFDLWSFQNSIKLSTLDVRETLLPREHQRELTNSYDIKTLITSFEHGVDLDFLLTLKLLTCQT
ncbi:hypothetical protein RCL1_000115 [Eukaryota sp. TZLM3-RCL]